MDKLIFFFFSERFKNNNIKGIILYNIPFLPINTHCRLLYYIQCALYAKKYQILPAVWGLTNSLKKISQSIID